MDRKRQRGIGKDSAAFATKARTWNCVNGDTAVISVTNSQLLREVIVLTPNESDTKSVVILHVN